MKTLHGIFTKLQYFLLAGFFFTGCYTQLETVNGDNSEGSGNADYTYDDTSDSANVAADNTYFSDDGYRESRYRMSFGFYAAPRHLWATGVWYDPGYGDYWDPWDPWYTPGYGYPYAAYPYPYWYPRYGNYPHYGNEYGYWGGHNYGYGGAAIPGRRRMVGTTRGDDGMTRARGPAANPATIPVASGVPNERTRTPAAPTVSVPAESKTRSREDTPWWERVKSENQNSSGRGRVTNQSSPTANANTPAVSRRRNGQVQSQPKQHGSNGQPARAKGQGRVHEQPTRQAPRQQAPRVSPPSSGRNAGGTNGGKSGGRSRKD